MSPGESIDAACPWNSAEGWKRAAIHAAYVGDRLSAENKELRRLLREAYECVDECGSQVLASEIHRALEGKDRCH